MQILTDVDTFVNLIDATDHASPDAPAAEDLAWLARQHRDWHADGPTPAGHADGPTPAEVLDADNAPWWASLPTCPELDTPIGLGPDAPCVACDDSGWDTRLDGTTQPCPACNAPRPARRRDPVTDFDQPHYRGLRCG
jgi:hypothetical protein